jgi:hypothetical protein
MITDETLSAIDQEDDWVRESDAVIGAGAGHPFGGALRGLRIYAAPQNAKEVDYMMRGCLYGIALTVGRALWQIVDVPPRSPLVAPFRAPMPARILVLDDEPAICALVARALEEQGYEVVTVGDGLAGLEAAERDGFPA